MYFGFYKKPFDVSRECPPPPGKSKLLGIELRSSVIRRREYEWRRMQWNYNVLLSRYRNLTARMVAFNPGVFSKSGSLMEFLDMVTLAGIQIIESSVVEQMRLVLPTATFAQYDEYCRRGGIAGMPFGRVRLEEEDHHVDG